MPLPMQKNEIMPRNGLMHDRANQTPGIVTDMQTIAYYMR